MLYYLMLHAWQIWVTYNFVDYAVPFVSLLALIAEGILAQATHEVNENATKQKACVHMRNKSLCIS